jgi:WD40 repeat protein
MAVTSWICRTLLACLAAGLVGSVALAQAPKLPTADDVKALQAKYRAEHEQVVKTGIAKRVLPAIMAKAEELAKKSEGALAANRLLQANEAIRQARWQLPYQPSGLPDHVSRIIGSFRLRHSDEIKAVAYSPDGTKLATASTSDLGSERTIKIWDLGNGHEILSYTGHTDKIRALLWTPDGQRIISAGMEKTIRIWDAATGKDIRSIDAVGKRVSALALSRDGKHLFTGQFEIDGNSPAGLFVYETNTGKLVREAYNFPTKLDALALSPDGAILASGDDNGAISLWQYPTFVDTADQPAYWTQQDAAGGAVYHLSFSPDGKTLARCGPFQVKLYATVLPGAPFQVAAPRLMLTKDNWRPKRSVFSKDGKTLFTGGTDGTIYHWDPETGQQVGAFTNAHAGEINGLVVNPEGSQLASCGKDYAVRLWDLDVVLQAHDFEGHDGSVWTAAFNPDGTKLVSASADKTVKVWQRDTGKALLTLTDHPAPVTVAQFSPDGKLIASAGGDKIIRIFDAVTGKPLRTCEGHQGTITFLDFSPNSKRIVSGGADRRVKIWDADSGKQVLSIDDNPSVVAGVAFGPDGKQIAVANVDQTIRLYDSTTGKLQQSWIAHGAAVNGVAFSPDGQYLASCGADTAVMVWPLATPGSNSFRLSGHTGPVSMVAFRNDSRHLVSCGADQFVKLWKLEGGAGKELQTFRGHKDWVTGVAFSKDGHYVVSSSVDRKLKVWEITSRDIPLLAEHTSLVETVAVSPDGKLIATGSRDRTIKLWDRETGVEIATLPSNPYYPLAIALTPGSKRLVTGNFDLSIRLWSVAPPREIVRSPAQLAAFQQSRGFPAYLSLDPAGKTLFVWLNIRGANDSARLEAYDLESGQQLFSVSESTRKINSVYFCANGQLAATGGKDGSVRLWEMKKNSANIAPGGDWFLFDKVEVGDITLTPDGKLLIASSNDGEVKIAKIAGREVLKTIKAHTGGINVCLVSPDGKRFVTAASDNVVKLWDTQTGEELRRWDFGKQSEPLVVNIAFTPDGRQLVTANANTTVYVLDLP